MTEHPDGGVSGSAFGDSDRSPSATDLTVRRTLGSSRTSTPVARPVSLLGYYVSASHLHPRVAAHPTHASAMAPGDGTTKIELRCCMSGQQSTDFNTISLPFQYPSNTVSTLSQYSFDTVLDTVLRCSSAALGAPSAAAGGVPGGQLAAAACGAVGRRRRPGGGWVLRTGPLRPPLGTLAPVWRRQPGTQPGGAGGPRVQQDMRHVGAAR